MIDGENIPSTQTAEQPALPYFAPVEANPKANAGKAKKEAGKAAVEAAPIGSDEISKLEASAAFVQQHVEKVIAALTSRLEEPAAGTKKGKAAPSAIEDCPASAAPAVAVTPGMKQWLQTAEKEKQVRIQHR